MPFAYGDSISGVFSATGLYGERLHIGLWGMTYVTGDGTGVLTDNTDTLKNILRLHRHTETVRAAQAEPFDTLSMCRDSIGRILAMSSDRLIEDRYIWYMCGYRYPIMETVEVATQTDGVRRPYLATTFLYIPIWQENELPFDFANNSLRQTDETQKDDNEKECDSDFPTDLKATANTANNSVRISYTLPESCTLRITVCDKSGILLVSQTFTHDAGYYEEDIPLPKSVNNVLLLYASCKDKVKSLKISQ